jgi:hypothetical protein
VWLTTVVALWVPLLFAIWQYVARGELRVAAEQLTAYRVRLVGSAF